MKKRIWMAGIAAVTVLSVMVGAYAYFSDKKSINVTANAAKLGITVDSTNFTNSIVANMVPGDTRDLSYTIKKESGSKDATVFSEITLTSDIAMSDPVEWYIQKTGTDLTPDQIKKLQDEATAASGGGTFNNLDLSTVSTSGTLKFLSLSSDKKVAKFVVGHGTLASESTGIPVNLSLRLSPSAGNEFMSQKCSVTAEIYAIQKDNLDQDGQTTKLDYVKSLITANESTS